MIRDEIYKIVTNAAVYGQGPARTTDLILAALNQERVGEVVLAKGKITRKIHKDQWAKIVGKLGSLIFREQEGK